MPLRIALHVAHLGSFAGVFVPVLGLSLTTYPIGLASP